MMIADTINQKIAEALKAHDEIRLSTLRMLSSALNYEFIAKQHKLSGEEELVVVRREVKKRQDAIDAYKSAGAHDREEKERKEQEILKGYLPPEMSDEEMQKLVDNVIIKTGAKEIKDMGKVIGLVMGEAKGTADGKKVAEMVKSKLV